MLQAVVKKGRVWPEEVPTPNVSEGSLLIKVVNSCISAGTELTNVSITGKPLIKRALEQPEQLKMVLNFARQNGVTKTLAKVKGTLEGGKPTGYSIAGVVVGIGKGVAGYEIGDRVSAAGAGIANHAEYVDVPVNLVMKIPKDMDFIGASTVTLGGIAMQGVRRADLRLGEICVVVGAGILGLLTQQILQLSGIRTIVTDLDEHRLHIARKLGAELTINPSQSDVVQAVNNFTGGYGCDAVLFTAAAASSEPLSQSFQMCKKKGKVVLVGVSGMNIKREDLYKKELDFLISTSYGPGRYDPNYEEKGLDYPFAYVRWTENRNMSEYLRLVYENKISLDHLIDTIFPIQQVDEAFDSLGHSEGPKPIITILDYGVDHVEAFLSSFSSLPGKKIITSPTYRKTGKKTIQVALIGAGGFAKGMHLPNMQKLSNRFQLRAVVNRTGQSGKAVAQQYNAAYATSDVEEVLQDSEVDLVLIATRHDSHASLTLQSLEAGKHVFVEKPLATDQEELEKLMSFYQNGVESKPLTMVGFNRRFSPYTQEIKRHTDSRINPLFIQYRMNAGYIPLDHWVHEHGGRIVGECCHLIDLMTFFTGSIITSISFENLNPTNERFSSGDNCSIILKYEDGSVCNIQYFAVGNKKFPKEYMEVHFDEKTIVMEDYKSLMGYGVKVKKISSNISRKGQLEELTQLYDHLSGKSEGWPIELWDLVQTTEATFLINDHIFPSSKH